MYIASWIAIKDKQENDKCVYIVICSVASLLYHFSFVFDTVFEIALAIKLRKEQLFIVAFLVSELPVILVCYTAGMRLVLWLCSCVYVLQ